MVGKLEQVLELKRARRKLSKFFAPPVGQLLRQESGLSLRDIARAVTVRHASVVLRWERGVYRPRGALAGKYLDVLTRLADELLERSVEELEQTHDPTGGTRNGERRRRSRSLRSGSRRPPKRSDGSWLLKRDATSGS